MPVLISTVHNLRETSERGGPTWYKELLYRVTDRLATRTTIVCQAAFDRHVRLGAVPAARLVVVPNFVDTQRFAPDDRRRQLARRALGLTDEFVWLAVGRLVKQKDYPNLLRAVRSLGDERMKVMVAGDGPLAAELHAMAMQLGLDRKVQFRGANHDILDCYAAADAFVMSSEFEGLSVALLESASMALPAVVTDAGGNSEIVCDGISGHVVDCADPVALVSAMRRVMQLGTEERAEMGANARRRCMQQFDRENVVQRWLDLYESSRSVGLAADQLVRPPALGQAESVNRQA